MAQQKSMPAVQLKHYTLYPVPNAQHWIDSTASTGKASEPYQVVLVFSELPGTEQRARLSEAGISLGDYLADNTFSATVTQVRSSLTASSAGLYAVYPFQPHWKITVFPDAGTAPDAQLELMVAAYPTVSQEQLMARVKSLGGSLRYSPLAEQHFYEITLPAGKLTELASFYGVRTISPAAHDQPLNFESTTATKTNIAQMPVALGGYGLLGDGMTIGVGDNTSGMNHVDLRDRIINYNPTPYTNHGMHINGIVGGAGTMNPRGQGFAPHATLVDHLYNLVWARTGTMFTTHNMTVTNNSYATVVGNCNFEGVYDAYSQALDTLCLRYPNVLHVFASANDGYLSCPPYLPSFGTVTGSYQPAKNVLVVAQSDKRYNWGVNSSRGPVRDGRLKPEITAIGTEVLSTRGGDLYLSAGGTSMACPQVSGAAALLQQRYKQLNGNTLPSSALIKLLLMNGATDIGNPGPDYTFGFGMMNLNRSLQMLNNSNYRLNTVLNGGQQSFTVTVPANTAQLKVMLYWHEVAASVLATKQLINDLDLEVVDASNNVSLPFVLNPDPARVDDPAVQGVDHLNNVEQVVINNPPAGTYTVRIKGSNLPTGGQGYLVAYDFIPVGVALTYPATGSTVQANDSLRIYWDASPDTRAFTLEFSSDNGGSWTTINNAIPAAQRYYTWYTPSVNTPNCLMRLTRNGTSQVYTTGAFTVNQQPAIRLNPVQCPGYMNITWSPVANATSYQVWRKKGPYLQPEAIVTDTLFTLKGLSLDTTYYMAVQPLFNGTAGYRSLGISRRPNDGTCAGSFSNGDLMVERLEAPVSGRQFTSSQPGSAASISVRIRNLDDVAATNYRVSYSFNGGAWTSQTFTTSIPATGSQVVTIPAALNLSATGNYTFRIAVTNLALTDNNGSNDTLNKTIRHMANAPVNLATGFTEDFETAANLELVKDTLGFIANDHWDFVNNNDTGRLRTAVNSDIVINGSRSISMDVLQYITKPGMNSLLGTFNAAAYSAASSEVRLDFDYKIHGRSAFPDSNKVWVRGSDAGIWRPLFAYNNNAIPGETQHARGISLTDVLNAGSQNFSTSTQLRFGQFDTTVIAMNDYGTGVTLDNIRLFTVQNDVALDSVLAPNAPLCNAANAPLTIRVYNGVTATLSNVQVNYRLDNAPVVTETLASLPGKTSVVHTFAALLNLSPGTHTVKTWVAASGDTYALNDTQTIIIRNLPVISTFPYLENFEANDGSWYTEGRNNSWAYGTPQTNHVQSAASGTKAWKTNLAGGYNDNELSYLYSPCLNIASLTKPMLSFSTVLDIENCGSTLCDAAWLEYTTDNGHTWTKLGNRGEGYAWYTDSANNLWNQQGNYRWHVASISLPVTTQPLRLRFVLASDPGTNAEGIAIDDIHIFNKDYAVYDGITTGPVIQSLSGSQLINYLSGNKILAQVNPLNQTTGNTGITVYEHGAPDTASQQYYLQRSFLVDPAQQPNDSVLARFYILDTQVISLVNATGCNFCSKPKDAYRLGISKYDDPVNSNENGTLSDNVNGTWTFYNYKRVKWVPYDNGYYAEVKLPSFSEIWFNDGGPGANLSLPNYAMGNNALLSVYPNPTENGILNLSWSTAMQRTIDISLVNMVGQSVYETTLTSLNGKNTAVLRPGRIPTGMYFLKCRIGDKNFSQKVTFR